MCAEDVQIELPGGDSELLGKDGARRLVRMAPNFVRRIRTWAVMIGLEEDGVVTAGTIFQPVTGVLHTAWRGEGAFRDGERIRVSPCPTLKDAMLMHSSLNLIKNVGYWDGFVRLVDATARQRGFDVVVADGAMPPIDKPCGEGLMPDGLCALADLGVIIQDGIKRMYVDGESIFYYLTVTNEPLPMPAMPPEGNIREGVLKGLYRFKASTKSDAKLRAQLLGSGTIMATS